jgi:4-amino-4-deoxy-L-arabinose transferase-like glycosyltransferase
MSAPLHGTRPLRSSFAAGLTLVLVVAAVFRFWRLGWGLEQAMWFPDEHVWAVRVQTFVPFGWQSFDAHLLVYPTLYGYVAGLATALRAAVGCIPAATSLGEIDAVFAARAVSAVASLAGVALVACVGRRIASPTIGLAAALFLAVTPLDALQVHYASSDPLLAALAVVVFALSLRVAARGSIGTAAAAGAAVGFATATKYTGLAFGTMVVWAILEHLWARRRPGLAALLLTSALVAAGAAALLGCPPCALHTDDLIKNVTWMRHATAWGRGYLNNHLPPTLGWYGRPYAYQLVASLPWSLGWPLYLLALAGVIVAVVRHDRADRVLLAGIVPYFAVIGGYWTTFPRYLLPLVPALALLAARALPAARAWAAVVVVAIAAYGAILTGSQVARFSYGQQEAVAQWVAGIARTESRPLVVGVPFFGVSDYFRVVAPFRRAGLRHVWMNDGEWLAKRADVLVIPEWYAIGLERDWPGSPGANELARLRSDGSGYVEAMRWPTSWYLQRPIDVRVDPAFAADLWQGEIGFRAYLRTPR